MTLNDEAILALTTTPPPATDFVLVLLASGPEQPVPADEVDSRPIEDQLLAVG